MMTHPLTNPLPCQSTPFSHTTPFTYHSPQIQYSHILSHTLVLSFNYSTYPLTNQTTIHQQQAHAEGLFDEAPEAFFPVTADPIKRQVSDLELSSFVQKAPQQVRDRSHRILKQIITTSSSSASTSEEGR